MSNLSLHYEVFGAEHLPPLIIVHGFFASSRNWRQIAKHLEGQYRVYSVDMRNHGASPHHPLMDYPSMAEDLRYFMDGLQLNSAHLLGHSMGGKVVMWFALHYPERVKHLLIADIAPVSYSHSFAAMIASLQALPLATLTNRKQADDWLSDKISDASFRQFLLQNLVLSNGHYQWRINLATFLAAAPKITAFPDASQLAPFNGKTCVLAGARSKFVEAEAFKPLFPQASLHQLADAGHWLHVEAPAAFIEQVQHCLST